jgi:hypothetical protein
MKPCRMRHGFMTEPFHQDSTTGWFAAELRQGRPSIDAAAHGEQPENIGLAPEWVPGDSLAPPPK